MPKLLFVYVLALSLMAPAFAVAQQREFSKNYIDVKTATWKGLILERSCFQKLGRDKATAAEHTMCALECLKKGQPLGVLTDDDGFMTIVGKMAEDNFAKLTQFIGRRVEVTGTSALPTGNYIPRQLDLTRIETEKN